MESPLIRTVLFVVFPDVKLLDLAGPLQVFADAVDEKGMAVYKTAVVSVESHCIKTDTPISITTDTMELWASENIDTLIVSGGKGANVAARNLLVIIHVENLIEKNRIAQRVEEEGHFVSEGKVEFRIPSALINIRKVLPLGDQVSALTNQPLTRELNTP